MSGMDIGERAVRPRRAVAAAGLTGLVILAWARFSLSRSGWAAILLGVLVIVARRRPIRAQSRHPGAWRAGLCLGAVGGLTVALVVALKV